MENVLTEQSPPQAAASFITTVTGAKQPICPPDVPEYNPSWLNEREQYLVSRGWEKEGLPSGMPSYRDPNGSRFRGEMRDAAELPVKGDDLKKTEIVRQMVVPPAGYNFTLEEALDIQRRRDAVGNPGASTLDRLGSCEQKCNVLEQQLEQTRARIRMLLSSTHLTFEGLKLGLRELVGA